jgi:hypothetical protein
LANLRTPPRKNRFSRAGKRLRDTEKLIRHRHGAALPDTDDVDIYLAPVARCFRRIAIDKGKPAQVDDVIDRLGLWCDTWAPQAAADLIADTARQAFSEPPRFDLDDEIGAAWRVTYAERQAGRLTTIGCYDVDRRCRTVLAKDRRRERDRLAKAEKRRAEGAVPRSVYEANSLSKTKPWELMGITRRTYERRRAAGQLVASVSPHLSSYCKPTDLRHGTAEVIRLPKKSLAGTTKPPAGAVVTSSPPQIGLKRDEDAVLVGNSIRLRRSFRTRFPTAMRLGKEMRAFALEAGFTATQTELMFDIFRNHHVAQRCYSADWTDTWFAWVNREVDIVMVRQDRQRRHAYYERRT